MSYPEHSAPPARGSSTSRLFSRQGCLCALLLGLCLLATWPVAAIGINDDWSYILTAQAFAHTHHFVYNGWTTAILGWQVVWGALFARLFGSSFTSIRLSMTPVALATVLLYRAVLHRFGLNRAHATFGTLTLALGPLFLPLSDVFMSDVPGLFSLLLCIYLCQRALASEEDRRVLLWLSAAALTNIVSGSVRQISWLGVLVVVPCCGWLLRRRRFVVPSTIVLWLIGVLSIRLMISWFLRHPYSLPEKLLPGHVNGHAIKMLGGQTWHAALTMLLFCLPVLAMGAAGLRPLRRRSLLRVGGGFVLLGLLCAFLVARHRTGLMEPPWLTNVVGSNGIMQSGGLFGSTHSLSGLVRLLVFAVFVFFALTFAEMLWVRRSAVASSSVSEGLYWHETAVLLLPLLVSYCALLLPRAAFIAFFDRYLLVIIAILLVFLLRWHQEHVSDRLPAVAIATLAVVAVLVVAGTHDLFAMDRARVELTNELQQAGIPRTAIRGGFTFDAVTQVRAWGYLNEARIVNPPGAYHPQPLPNGPCAYWFQPDVPAIQAKYALAADPTPCLGPSPFPPVSYHTWLPPATRQLFIGTVLTPK